jgi:hypothetical protein
MKKKICNVSDFLAIFLMFSFQTSLGGRLLHSVRPFGDSSMRNKSPFPRHRARNLGDEEI